MSRRSRSKRGRGAKVAPPPGSDRVDPKPRRLTVLGRLIAFWRALWTRRHPRAAHSTISDSSVDSSAGPRGQADFAPTRLVTRRGAGEDDDEADWLPPSRATRGIDVSEEPMHTLPAELQDEFNHPPPPKPPPKPPPDQE